MLLRYAIWPEASLLLSVPALSVPPATWDGGPRRAQRPGYVCQYLLQVEELSSNIMPAP